MSAIEKLPPPPEPEEISITTAAEFLSIGDAPDGNYRLTVDIDLTAILDKLPLCSDDAPFTGALDGNGHTLTGLTNGDTAASLALFHTVDGAVKNLTLADVALRGDPETRTPFAGIAFNNNGVIENCDVSGVIENALTAGGIAETNNGELTNCTGSVIFTNAQNAGGIARYSSGTITDCTFSGSVESIYNSGECYAGGITASNSGTVSGCVFSGAVSLQNHDYYSYSGGIAGKNTGEIVNCANTGTVSGSDRTGGIAGENASGENSAIRSCYNSGTVFVSHADVECYAGGIAGYNYGLLADCFHTGTVTGQGYYPITGGLVGVCHSVGSMRTSYGAGDVSGAVVGACAGYMWSNKIENVYHVSTGSGIGSAAGDGETAVLTALTAEQAADPASFAGFDFDSVWQMGNLAPLLQGIAYAPAAS